MSEINVLSWLELAKDVVRLERQTLQALEEDLSHSFVEALEILQAAAGRIIVTGVGKSALVGGKMVATFNSLGTPAVFMHAADAIHGDLGILQQGDVLLVLSKSGESQEIRALLPVVKNLGNPIVGVGANLRSYLSCHADAYIHTPVEREADPNNLAPTASAVAQMAVGDALAACLMSIRGFQPKDFAVLHPGGTLGKQLTLRVSDLIKTNERPVVVHDAGIRTVIMEISSKRLGATAVLRDDQLVGIITDGDLRRMMQRASDLSLVVAADIMTRQPKTIATDALASAALDEMRQHNITQLLVLDTMGSYCGVVHIHDLLREGLT